MTPSASIARGARQRRVSVPALFGLLRDAAALARQRRQLALLEPERLTDLGLSPDAARREAARPFWDLPRPWRG